MAVLRLGLSLITFVCSGNNLMCGKVSSPLCQIAGFCLIESAMGIYVAVLSNTLAVRLVTVCGLCRHHRHLHP
jgi:hypothetical protein